MRDNSVVILVGETGSGKTTQIAQADIGEMWGGVGEVQGRCRRDVGRCRGGVAEM